MIVINDRKNCLPEDLNSEEKSGDVNSNASFNLTIPKMCQLIDDLIIYAEIYYSSPT